MTFNEYQAKSIETAEYPKVGHKLVYPTIGLVGEAGEVAEKVKKILRNDNGVISKEAKEKLMMELGDVLWYLAQIASELGLELDKVAEANLNKLLDRRKRNVIKSEGDNR